MRRSSRNVEQPKNYKLFADGKLNLTTGKHSDSNEPQVKKKKVVVVPSPATPEPVPPPSSPRPESSTAWPSPPPTPPPSPPPPDGENNLSEEDQVALVRRLWLDPRFAGSFTGAKTMAREVFLKTRQKIPMDVVYKALRTVPTYLTHLRPIRQYEVAHYNVSTVGEVVQGKQTTQLICK
jgi:hypothetical protein